MAAVDLLAVRADGGAGPRRRSCGPPSTSDRYDTAKFDAVDLVDVVGHLGRGARPRRALPGAPRSRRGRRGHGRPARLGGRPGHARRGADRARGRRPAHHQRAGRAGPRRAAPLDGVRAEDGTVSLRLPPLSWAVVELEVTLGLSVADTVAPVDEERAEVGVGPWVGEWPTDERYDPELLADGDRRNVVDRYRYWTVEAIVADLDTRRHPFHVAIENWAHDLNIGSVVRTANAFLAAEVHIVGNRRWNRRGAMVTDRYQHVRHHPTVDGPGRLGGRAATCRCSASTTCPAPSPWRATRSRARASCCSGRSPSGCPTPPARPPSTSCTSPSSARPARSTRARPPRSRCTPGSRGTRRRAVQG